MIYSLYVGLQYISSSKYYVDSNDYLHYNLTR